MKEPGIVEYALLIAVCIVFAAAGLYLLANFNRLFRRTIRNELLRKNAAAWLVIFCLSIAMVPMSGGFFYLLEKHGWGWTIGSHFISATGCTLIIYNLARLVAGNRQLKKLSFIKHSALVVITLIAATLAINIPLSYWMYGKEAEPYMKYVLSNSIYLAAATGIVYAGINYLNIERKRKFHEKELELSRLRELKTKAELDALHSKINPHFLYNALNSIADLSVTDGKKGRKMTIALADLFRYSINYSDNNYSTVKDELAMAEVYLQIEKIRFEDQLSYSLQVDENAGHYLVPRFLLQPIVENAVKHGLKATGKMTEIIIEVKKDGEGLVVNVADNGPAFPDELSPGYGVKSVFDKLDLLFPEKYAVQFTNKPRKQVSVHINKLMKDGPVI
ncbi:MAG: sensor histidine kinase [Bacteroidota bacterium]